MFDTVCSFERKDEVFAQAIHPTEPLVALGGSFGAVETLRLPPIGDEDVFHASTKKTNGRRNSDGTGVIDSVWSTHRHKGSCRCLAYSGDGRTLFSAGTDRIIKAADSENGRVTGKVALPTHPTFGTDDTPTTIHALSPQTFLLGTEQGMLYLYDLRDPSPSSDAVTKDASKTAFTTARPAQSHQAHYDDITSITPLPPSSTSTSGYSKQWLSTSHIGLTITDLRRGILVQNERLMYLCSSLWVTGLSGKKSSAGGERALVGDGFGGITLFKKGEWDDEEGAERITVSPGTDKELVECMALIPDDVGSGTGKRIACGIGDGEIKYVQLGSNQIVGTARHGGLYGVTGLGFDVGGRMVSSGDSIVKVWTECEGGNRSDNEDGEDEAWNEVSATKHALPDSADSDEEAGGGSGDDEDGEGDRPPMKRRKKRKKGKAQAKGNNFSFAGLD